MSVELTEEVSGRLTSDHCGWLTTVTMSGRPVPRLVWFYFDGTDLRVYSMPPPLRSPTSRRTRR